MKAMRFTGATAREVMGQVKAALGEHALIISSKRVGDQIEVVATGADEIEVTQVTPAPSAPARPAPTAHAAQSWQGRPAPVAPPVQEAPAAPVAQPQRFAPAMAAYAQAADLPAQNPALAQTTTESVRPAPVTAEAVRTSAAASGQAEAQMAEALANFQNLMSSRLDGLVWGDTLKRAPTRVALMRDMLAAGFSTVLTRELLSAMPEHLTENVAMFRWLRQELAARLQVVADDTAVLRQGGVYALVGPTGVGKTTTIAKLAARWVQKEGRDALALITTDGYRIGAHEQLQTYGRIMGVPVFPMRHDGDLKPLMQRLEDKRVVLIDNVGLSQRDQGVERQLAMLDAAGRSVQRLVVLNAASQGDTLEEVLNAFSVRAESGETQSTLRGCIITKVDESTHIGSVLDAVIRHGVPIHYVSGGQRVPEDLTLPDAMDLVERALAKVGQEKSGLYAPAEADLAALMGNVQAAAENGPGGPGTEERQRVLHWLMAQGQPEQQGQEGAEAAYQAALNWIAYDRASRLARESWRDQVYLPGDGRVSVASLAQLWLKTARDAYTSVCENYMLALHGRVSLAANVPVTTLAGALMMSDTGQVMTTPAQQLLMPYGSFSACEPHDMPVALDVNDAFRQRVAWLQQGVAHMPTVHVFDRVPQTQMEALDMPHLKWLMLVAGSLKLQTAQGAVSSVRELADHLAYVPLRRRPDGMAELRAAPAGRLGSGDILLIGQARVNWLQAAPVEGEVGHVSDVTPAELRLVVIRSLNPETGQVMNQWFGLSNMPEIKVSADMLAVWMMQYEHARVCFKYMAQAWPLLDGVGNEDAWLQRAMLAGQLGAATWQLTHTTHAAPFRELVTRLTGWTPAQSGKNTLAALLKTFAFLEMAV